MSIATPKELYDEVQKGLRMKHYSYHTEQTYIGIIYDYVRFHKLRHTVILSVPECSSSADAVAAPPSPPALSRTPHAP